MTTLTISVLEPMRSWVETRVESGAYADAGEYLRELIRRDHKDGAERDELIAALAEGEASGTSERQVPDILAGLRRELSGDAA